MDNPTSTLFQGADIKINNSQNNEEEEDIEDQKRRKEELQNLLTNALDDFNYDDSTVNSSTNMSVASFDEIQHNYRQASDPNEQLKVLYDVRVRELNNLRKEFEDYKTQSKNDISSLKNKLLLLEAETRQLKISLKNAEDLLVEKTSDISELKNVINNKDLQLTNYEKTIEKYQIEVCTYQSTINELQLKLTDSGPFSTAAKRFNSEEIQKAHQEQISRLESLLDEQTKISGILEKEKIVLQQDIHNLIEQKRKNEDEDKSTINALTKTLDDAQLQCKNLLDVIEMLTKENNHLQERLHHINNSIQEDNQNKTLNYNVAHTEKLKKMLLDKSIQIDSLNAKLKNYENDIKELVEYRQLKCDIYKKEFQQCENKEHTKSLIVMQNDIQNYRRIIEDKNQQILNLNFTNRDLQEKIEEMLLQTRNDIQNLSHKYSLPQLEQMTEELKNAEEKVKELQEKLEKSEERRLSLMEKQQKTEQTIVKELKQELEAQILNTKTMEKQKNNLESQIKQLQKELDISLSELNNLKQFSDELMNENAKLKLKLIEAQTQIDNIDTISQRLHETDSVKNEYEILKQQLNTVMVHLQNNKAPKHDPEIITNLEQSMEELLLSIDKSDLKVLFQDRVTLWKKQLEIIKSMIGADTDQLQTQFKETLQKLQESQNKVKKLEDVLEDLTSAKTIAEGEKCTYQYQLKDCENQLQHTCKTNKKLEAEMDALTNQLQEKEDRMYQLMQNNAKEEIDKLKEALSYKDNILKICEENKKELNELLHKTQLQLEDAKNEVLVLQNKLAEMDDTKVRHSIEQELKETESQVEQSKLEEADGCETEHFKKCVQAEILKCELKLREDLQVEYLRKMRDIEKKYKKACSATNQLYEEQVEKMKNQETRYREYLARILAECAGKIDEFEKEKQTLLSRINSLQTEFANFKKRTHLTEEQYKQSVQQIQIKSEKRVEEWKSWSKQFVSNCLKVELINKKCRDGILTRMKDVDSEVANIEKAYKEKVRKCLKNDKIKIQC